MSRPAAVRAGLREVATGGNAPLRYAAGDISGMVEPIAVPGRSFGRLGAAGFTNVFAWMGFTTVAMQWVSVAEGALLVYTMPLWVCVFEWPIRGVRPSGRRVGPDPR